YLRARGVPHEIATDLLTLAFLAEAVEEVEDEALREEVVGHLTGWLERRRG
ncbi:MAG: Fe-S cluster assembly protein SufD, partial [Roseovarius sp.]|nr:Fe-S cluster assembly protein SufD [Roseovarius sp.]